VHVIDCGNWQMETDFMHYIVNVTSRYLMRRAEVLSGDVLRQSTMHCWQLDLYCISRANTIMSIDIIIQGI